MKKNKILIFLLVVGVMVLPMFGSVSTSFTEDKYSASTKQLSEDTRVTQKLKESPLDKALITLWQVIDFINKVVVVFKDDKITYLMTPRGAITTNRPIFEWSPVTNASGYCLHLYDWQGNGWKMKTPAPKFIYPELGEELHPGTYTWKVEILTGEDKEGEFSEPAIFKIISAEEKLQVEEELQSAKELFISYYILTGSIYLKNLFFNEAILNFQKAIGIAPNNPYAYLSLATAYNAIAKNKEAEVEWEKAISNFNQALKFAPDNPNLHAGLALAYEAVGKAKEAEAEWEKAKGSEAYYLYRNETK